MEAAPLTASLGEQNLRPSYRPDIDGLRAVAILSVVAYHVFPKQIPGGFLGVDVFFVISGFLIATIIFKSLSNGNFSFWEFYAHRVRRIFPALILVLAFSLFLGWHALLPSEFMLLGKHVVSSICFVENFTLRKEAGYFDLATSLKPLMHLWSLAIEEQFYLVFPLLVWGAWRLRLNVLALVTVIFAVSFVSYIHEVGHHPIKAFFSPRPRFWELMAGVILAYLMLNHAGTLAALRNLGRRQNHVAASDPRAAAEARTWVAGLISLIGLLLIAWVVFGLDRYVPQPNFMGEIFAILGAVLLIFAGQPAWINRFALSNRLVVFIGLISYALYVWHWPLLSFLTIVDGDRPPPSQRLIAVFIAFVLAVLTYRFVELPIRRGTVYRRRAVASLIAAMAVLLLVGSNSTRFAPVYDEATQKIIQSWDFTGYPNPDGIYLDKDYQFDVPGKDNPNALLRNNHNKIIFIGDSHMLQYKPAVDRLFKTQISGDFDPPEVIFLENVMLQDFTILPQAFNQILEDKSASIVIFSQYWAIKYASDKINYSVRCCGNGLMQTAGDQTHTDLSADQIAEKKTGLENLIATLKHRGKEVYIILDNPFGEELAPRSLLKRSFFHKIEVSVAPLTKQEAIERDEPARSWVQQIANDVDAKIIDPIKYLCNQDTCPALAANGMPIYKDYDHLSAYASAHLVRYLDFILRPGTAE